MDAEPRPGRRRGAAPWPRAASGCARRSPTGAGAARCRRGSRRGRRRRAARGRRPGVRARQRPGPRRRHGRRADPPRPARPRTSASPPGTAATASTGDGDAFGTGAAILVGDLALVWSDELLGRSGISADGADPGPRRSGTRCAPRSPPASTSTCCAPPAGCPGPQGALTVARYKSAGYTVQRPLQLGAAIAGAGPEVAEACTAIGLPLGEAFQLRDDVLGVFGDPAVTGKSADDDLREGKQTLLVALAEERADDAGRRAAARAARQPRRRPGGVRRAARADREHRRPRPRRGADRRADRAGPRGHRRGPARRRRPRRPGRPRRRGDLPHGLTVRTVPGRTDRVVVVGAGLAGLAAALRLRGAGREVTVVERGAGPGRPGRPGGARRLRPRHRPVGVHRPRRSWPTPSPPSARSSRSG